MYYLILIEKNEMFVRSFSSVFFSALPQVVSPQLESATVISQMCLTLNVVFSLLAKLVDSSAPGSDEVKSNILEACAVTIS